MNTDLAAQRALDRLAEAGLQGLSEKDRILAAVWTFAAGVGNSGFKGYFNSHRGDLAFVAPNALRRIDALALAEIAAEANAVFGSAGPSPDLRLRRTVLAALPASATTTFTELDRQYHACTEDVDELLERFLAKHPEA